MGKENKHLIKTNERLAKAGAAAEVQSKRVQSFKTELEEVNTKLEQAKATFEKLSFDEQESKLGEIDKLTSRKQALQMRVELLSGVNAEITSELIEAAKAFKEENQKLAEAEAALEANYKVLEKEYNDKVEANKQAVNDLRNVRYDFKITINSLLMKAGFTEAQAESFCKEHKIPKVQIPGYYRSI